MWIKTLCKGGAMDWAQDSQITAYSHFMYSCWFYDYTGISYSVMMIIVYSSSILNHVAAICL